MAFESEGLARFVMRKWEDLRARRMTFDVLFQEIAEFVLPRKSNIIVRKHPGERQTTRIFDSSPIFANELLASSLQSTLTSSSIRWFALTTNDPELNADDEAKDWLADATTRMFSAFQNSNMESEMNELYLDLGAFGTAAMFVGEKPLQRPDFNGFTFKTLDLSEYVIEENHDGVVDSVYRKFTMSAREASRRWGIENMPDSIIRAVQFDPMKEFDFVHGVFTRELRDPTLITNDNFPIANVIVAADSKHVVLNSGFREFPFVVPRWRKTAGEIYGRSPGMIALPDVRTLNRAKELDLRAWNKAIDPPIVTDDESVLGAITLRPGGINVTRPNARFEPLQTGARFDVTTIKVGELQDAIRKAFFSDQLVLPPFQGTPMTATEVERRLEQIHRILGPTMGRLKHELLRPMVKNAFNIMWRSDGFSEPPQVILEKIRESGRPVLDVEFLGPLSRAQKFADVVAIERWIAEFAAPLSQVDPQVFDKVDTDMVMNLGAERLGVPPSAIRNSDDVAAMREQRNQAQQAQATTEQAATQAKALGDVAPLIKALGDSRVRPVG